MIQKYTQTTYETCLACCLLQAVNRITGTKLTKKKEFDCLIHSLKYSKDDFVTGHIDFIIKKFPVKVQRIVEKKLFYNFLKKMKQPKQTKLLHQKVDLKLINRVIEKQPIVVIDSYELFHIYHYPHYITILSKTGDNYKIFDVWDGKEKTINKKVLNKSISSLRDHLKMSPQVLIIEQL